MDFYKAFHTENHELSIAKLPGFWGFLQFYIGFWNFEMFCSFFNKLASGDQH